MPEHFQAVVVGSGFGGSVMAFELAKAGMNVCLLERGRPFPPGSFPRSPREFGRNFWDPSKRLYGMFDLWSFHNSDAVVASGLGGGSLIYANVLIRMPPEWFVRVLPDGTRVPWPIDRATLEPHYEAVEGMLGAQRFPDDLPRESTAKARAFEEAATKVGLRTYRPLLAVAFRDGLGNAAQGEPIPGVNPNLHDAPRSTCRLCGECDIGCNYGSKNTLDLTYLSAAQRLGVQIRPMSEVREFGPVDQADPAKGYKVWYVKHDPENETSSRHLLSDCMTCDRLIIAAGTFGTNYLFLKNRQRLQRISHTLGSGYSTNGDLLAFAMRCKKRSAHSAEPRALDPSRGPVITTCAEIPFESGKGGLIQDAGYPEFVSWLAEASDIRGLASRMLRFILNRLVRRWSQEPRSEIDLEISRLIGPGALSSSSLPLLGMGCDSADGQFRLLTDRRRSQAFLALDWTPRNSAECFRALSDSCSKIAIALGGTPRINPLTRMFGRTITVHPLGGCSMGETFDTGVVGPTGEVFNYPNLYIADGSIMPGPIGTNPSLTIAAVARHIAMRIVERWTSQQAIEGGPCNDASVRG